jgi:basic membrane protein A and related proteins
MTGRTQNRRTVIKLAGATLMLPAMGSLARAEGPIKTAAIYTVPVEQQWVSRIHKAATTAKERGDIDYVFSEKVANTDYERVMREYCEAGKELIVGEAFAVEDAARAVAKDYPDRAFLIGSSFKPDAAVPNFSVFDNYIQDASYLVGIIAGMVGGYPIP